jgi:hypothetical protein
MKQYEYKEAVHFLNEQYWHDSVLYEFRIIRTNSADQATIILDLIISEDGAESKKCVLTFNDCYYIETQFFGGVDAISDGEMIYQAEAVSENTQIDRVVESWKPILEPKNLFYFSMSLSSTNSEIKIVCKSVSVENYEVSEIA